MAINLELIIDDEGLLASNSLISLLSQIEHTSRNASVIVCIRIASELNLPSSITQLASIRLWATDESFFWIESVRPGSKKFFGRVVAPAIIATVLTSTVGESLKEGWKKTHTHEYISSSIPRIENYLVSEFQRLFNDSRPAEEDYIFVEPVVVRPDSDEHLIEIRSRSHRPYPSKS